MQAMIYNPLEEYGSRFKASHFEKTNALFEELVRRSSVPIAENRETVKRYHLYKENLVKLRRKLNWLRFLRVLLILLILTVPLVIWKLTPKIRAMREDIASAEKKAEELLSEAWRQMQPLCSLFTGREATDLVEETLPLLDFTPHFSAQQEEDMRQNYDFDACADPEQSTLDLLAGRYNENPFLFENRRVHTMGSETYHGYKTIHWTETYRDSNGKLRTRTRSQTLHATVTKPKPFYSTQVVLHYCAQGGPDLTFTRDATDLHEKSERELRRYVKRGERRLKKKTDRAIRASGDFTGMSNTEFEVLFDALDRSDEVQFRTLFTPLAQTNTVDLILSKIGYGDDFHFIKRRRTNTVLTAHSQGRALTLSPEDYADYSFDTIKENFFKKNEEHFKATYFDFAPLLAIPLYQERPVHSLMPIPEGTRRYAAPECEALANCVADAFVVHPQTKTEAILKVSHIGETADADRIEIAAHSYDIEPRVDIVPVFGGDGRFHNVSVPWEEYVPLSATNRFAVSAAPPAGESTLAERNGLKIYKI